MMDKNKYTLIPSGTGVRVQSENGVDIGWVEERLNGWWAVRSGEDSSATPAGEAGPFADQDEALAAIDRLPPAT